MRRSFPPPWTINEHNDACFIACDHNGHAMRCGEAADQGRGAVHGCGRRHGNQQSREAGWLEQLNRGPSQGRDRGLSVASRKLAPAGGQKQQVRKCNDLRRWLAENSLAANYHSVGIETAFRK